MKQIDNRDGITGWGYHDSRLGKGFGGTRDQIILQVQQAYVGAGLEFREEEIPALIDNWMCEQGLAKNCSERIEGLGDVVALLLKPAVLAFDATFGTNVRGCGGCRSRQQKLNEIVPL